MQISVQHEKQKWGIWMDRVLENNNLKVTISDAGAELISVWDKSRNAERIWRGDSAVWGRHAPILFPFVGKVAGGKYSYKGREYKMTSHGFARDRQFELVSEDGGSVTHVLRWNEESLTVYPFEFALYVKHSLENADSRSVKVEWRVVNEAVEGGEDMLYGIGGHPAFTFPRGVKPVDCSLRIYGGTAAVNGNNISDNVAICRALRYRLLDTAGCIDMSQEYVLDMPESCARITENMFDKDALIVPDNQVNHIELLDAAGKAYVTMDCQGFPYFGIWSKEVDEFICLEPWYSVADVAGCDGNIENKAGMQRLAAGDSREYAYTITF